MAAQTYRTRIAGKDTLVTAPTVSAGAATGNTIVATTASGQFDASVIPTSVSGNVVRNENAASAISASTLVNFGGSGVRPADSTSGYPANGFALAAISSGASGPINLIGILSGLSGLTEGADYYLGTNGAAILAAALPTASGSLIQHIGVAVSTTEINFEYSEPTYIQ